MSQRTKIFITVILVFLFIWGVGIFHFIHPLARTSSLQVIYGEGEDFFANAAVYNKIFDKNIFYLYLPHARTEYRWWMIDFNRSMIYSAEGVRSLPFKRKYILRDDPIGIKVDDKPKMGEWYWHFTQNGTSFSGSGFTCSVKKK